MVLCELKKGESATIKAVKGNGRLRLRLLEMGLTPNTSVTLVRVAPMGDPIEAALRGYSLLLRRDEAEKIVLKEKK